MDIRSSQFHLFSLRKGAGGLLAAFLLLSGLLQSCNEPPPVTEIQKPQPEYTLQKPGQWAGLEEEHLPVVTVFQGKASENIFITVPLKGSPVHYIELVGIMDEQKKDLLKETFSGNTKHVEKRFTLVPVPPGKLKVYARCNLHDLWTVPLTPAQP